MSSWGTMHCSVSGGPKVYIYEEMFVFVVFSASQNPWSCEDGEASRIKSSSKFNIFIGWINSFLKIGNHSRLDWWVCSGRGREPEQVDIFGQLHQALVVSQQVPTWNFSLEVTLQLGEVKERPSRRLLFDPYWRYETPSNLCAKVYPPLLRWLTTLTIPQQTTWLSDP